MTEYGLQLYSVRDITKIDLNDSLRRVSELGYKYVEFAGFFDHSAEDVKAWLDEYGLVAIGTHTQIAAITPENIDETIAYHKAIGCFNLIVPSADWSSEEKMEENIAVLNFANAKLSEAGISLGYHNHSKEFYPTTYGKVIEDEIISRTDVLLEVDTFWSFNAGIDTIAFLEEHKDRIKLVHLKDGISCKKDYTTYETSQQGAIGKSVGSGEAPVVDVIDWANSRGVKMVVESEGLEPTGIEEVARCFSFLKELGK